MQLSKRDKQSCSSYTLAPLTMAAIHRRTRLLLWKQFIQIEFPKMFKFLV